MDDHDDGGDGDDDVVDDDDDDDDDDDAADDDDDDVGDCETWALSSTRLEATEAKYNSSLILLHHLRNL